MATDGMTLSFTIQYFDLKWLVVPALIYWPGRKFFRWLFWILGWEEKGLIRRFFSSDRFWKSFVVIGYLYFLELALYYHAHHAGPYRFASALAVVIPATSEINKIIGRIWLNYRTRRVLKKVKKYYEQNPC